MKAKYIRRLEEIRKFPITNMEEFKLWKDALLNASIPVFGADSIQISQIRSIQPISRNDTLKLSSGSLALVSKGYIFHGLKERAEKLLNPQEFFDPIQKKLVEPALTLNLTINVCQTKEQSRKSEKTKEGLFYKVKSLFYKILTRVGVSMIAIIILDWIQNHLWLELIFTLSTAMNSLYSLLKLLLL